MSLTCIQNLSDPLRLSEMLLKCYGARGERFVMARAILMRDRLGSSLAREVVANLTDYYGVQRELGDLARCA